MAVAREAEQVIKRLMAQSPSAPVCMANIAEQDTNPKLHHWSINACEW